MQLQTIPPTPPTTHPPRRIPPPPHTHTQPPTLRHARTHATCNPHPPSHTQTHHVNYSNYTQRGKHDWHHLLPTYPIHRHCKLSDGEDCDNAILLQHLTHQSNRGIVLHSRIQQQQQPDIADRWNALPPAYRLSNSPAEFRSSIRRS